MWLFFSVCHLVFPQNFSSIHVHHHAIYLVNLHVQWTLSTTMSAALSVYKVALVKKNSIFCVYSRDHILNSEMTHSDQKYCVVLSLIFNAYKIQLFKKEWPPMNTSTPPPSSLVGNLKVSLSVGCHLTHLDHPLGLFSSVRFQMPSKIACI